jgi:hypothetical protein
MHYPPSPTTHQTMDQNKVNQLEIHRHGQATHSKNGMFLVDERYRQTGVQVWRAEFW